MPSTSALKHSERHFRTLPGAFRTLPGAPRGRAWLWVLAWAAAGVGGLAQQQFPEASEDNHFVFRSDGTYSFSYDTGGGQHQSFRIERRDSLGRVSGRFGYVDPEGALRITEYQAGEEGYRASMETYHLVRWFPRPPLLVGPLPKAPSEAEGERRGPKDPGGRDGTPLFFPPEGPVLVIGPLPKPLQPSREAPSGAPPASGSSSRVLRGGVLDALLGGSLEGLLPEAGLLGAPDEGGEGPRESPAPGAGDSPFPGRRAPEGAAASFTASTATLTLFAGRAKGEARTGLSARSPSPSSSTPSGATRSGQEAGRYRPVALPPIPALTYLPVAKDAHGAPPDLYSYLPQTFNPFSSG